MTGVGQRKHVRIVDSPGRLPCVLVLDTSPSMKERKIAALNDALIEFTAVLMKDAKTRTSVDLAVVTFDTAARVIRSFVRAPEFIPPKLVAARDGATATAKGIREGLDLIVAQLRRYRDMGVAGLRPWLVLITDGAPSPGDAQKASLDLAAATRELALVFYAIGIGDVNLTALGALAPSGVASALKPEEFPELFEWLTQTMTTFSIAHDRRLRPGPPGRSTKGKQRGV